ncbi:MAG TPA: hypothetical protein VGK16_07075 [Candidatus Limnocylindrales bacterium]|jgi:hypothetical protein
MGSSGSRPATGSDPEGDYGDHVGPGRDDEDAGFAFGLEAIIDGLERVREQMRNG